MKLNYEKGSKPNKFTLDESELEYNTRDKELYSIGKFGELLNLGGGSGGGLSDSAGFTFQWAGKTAPVGTLECMGQEVAVLDYPELYDALGDTWDRTAGAGVPLAGNFRLPPQSVGGLGVFIRGKGAVDVGTYQGDVFKSHTHVTKLAYDVWFQGGGTNRGMDDDFSGGGTNNYTSLATGDATETRPRSITMMLCIVTGKGELQKPAPTPLPPFEAQLKVKKTVQTDKVNRAFSTSWADGKEWDLYTKRVGSTIQIHYELPARNDTDSWNGGYDMVYLSIDGGAYVPMGNCGYGGSNVMNNGAQGIGRGSTTMLLDTQEVLDATTIRFRFRHKAYAGSYKINQSSGVNQDGSNPLYADQFFSKLIIEEF